ncbi:MAG: thiol peroxidase [Candidatus Omnitrophica bacterium]|nr:thiol peroxidase [Candidatus Omnitrophota bacterium]
MANQVTFQGNPLNLEGNLVKLGDKALDFSVVNVDLKKRSLVDYAGKVKVITTFPSIDTPVCDLQVREFNKRAAGLSKDVVIIGISKDLPFAQKRFCGAHGISGVEILSDYKSADFSIKYGLHIKELALTARSVIIVDKNDKVKYVQLVKEMTQSPNFDEVFAELKKMV